MALVRSREWLPAVMRRVLRGRSDVVLAVVAALILTVETLGWDGANHAFAMAAAVLAGLGLSLRRSHPIQGFLVSAGGLAGIEMSSQGVENESVGFLLVYVVALYSLGRYVRGWWIWLGGACVVGAMVVFYVGDSAAQGKPLELEPSNMAFALLFVGGPWAAGLAIGLRRAREETLRSRNDELIRDQAEQAVQTERAIAAERARIARELHDVVSHAISVSVLQARGARRLLGVDEAAVSRALDAIEHTNAQALGDMRRLLSLLRDANDPGRSPQPSLLRLDELVNNVKASGLPVTVAITGAADEVPPGVGLSAYRIVQEALTNSLRHAGPQARAQVELTFATDHVDVAVVDSGHGNGYSGSTPRSGHGHGLIGIRERVATVGGSVNIGPEPSGGFAVRARLPYSMEAP